MPHSVLIADDEPFIVRGLRKILPWDELGFAIVGEASDGASAARLIVELQPDIMVSDICMPGMSGIEILKLASLSNLSVKVIFLSGHREFSFARDAVSYGAVDYLMKPVRVDELRRALGRAIGMLERERGEEAPPRAEAAPVPAEGGGFLDLAPPGDWPFVTAFALVEREDGASRGEPGGGGRRNLRLLRFAIINILKRLSGQERGISAAEREGVILAVMGHGPDEDPDAFLELARTAVLAELGTTLAASRGPSVAAAEGPRASCESALGGLLGAEASKPRGSEVAGIKRAIDLMESRYREALTLESVAAVACMNPYYFSALFKKRVGVNYKDYLSRLRAEEGRRILLTTDMTCTEIAALSGLGDARRFGETFKKYFGAAPAEYRSRVRRRLPK